MSLQDIAAALLAHLSRIEADTVLNPRDASSYSAYFCTSASRSGTKVWLKYSASAEHTLTKAEAAAYLAWLDAGNNGTHLDMIRRADS